MIKTFKSLLENNSIAILGFGREGQSSYTLLRKAFPNKPLTVIDKNEAIRNNSLIQNDTNLSFITGHDYMASIDEFDMVIKSPGIPSKTLAINLKHATITSQTDIFLHLFGKQVIGVTGTKGKSTTTSLIQHILINAGYHSLFVGNIGIPPFDCINELNSQSVIIMELSSHQLEYVSHSPHIAVLLNLFQEHLDHYHSYEDYQLAKLNIAKFQNDDDYFIYNIDNDTLRFLVEKNLSSVQHRLPFSIESDSRAAIRILDQNIELKKENDFETIYDTRQGQLLQGHHNMYNIMAAATACYLYGVPVESIAKGIETFKGLEHRIEHVGEFGGISWYNDSIATIPEATIEAVKTLQNVDTLILGGFDRGIDYNILYPFLKNSALSNLIFVGEAGKRMMKEFTETGIENFKILLATNYSEVVTIASEITQKGKICLLSPAAASYDMFKNFEERGQIFKKNVRDLNPSQD